MSKQEKERYCWIFVNESLLKIISLIDVQGPYRREQSVLMGGSYQAFFWKLVYVFMPTREKKIGTIWYMYVYERLLLKQY